MSNPLFSYPEASPPPDDPPPPVASPTQVPDNHPDWVPGVVTKLNLLPPSLRLRAAVNQARARAIIVIIVAAVIVVALVGFATSSRMSAESELQAAQQRVATAEAAKSQYSDVPGVYSAIAEAQKELSTAMSQEVQFSGLLTNLGLKIPPRVSVASATMTVGSAAAGKKSAKDASGKSGPDLGSVMFTGQAQAMPDVAAFLDALATLPEYSAIHLDSATLTAAGAAGSGGSTNFVQYSISAQFTEKALSGRFGAPTGSASASPSPSGPATASPSASPGASHG